MGVLRRVFTVLSISKPVDIAFSFGEISSENRWDRDLKSFSS